MKTPPNWPPNWPPNFWAGASAVVIGLVIILLGAGIIPAPESSFHAPHWVVGAAGLAFLCAGVAIWLGSAGPRDALEPWRRLGVDLSGLTIIVCFAAMFSWIGFAPGEREFSGGLPLIGAKANNSLGRIVFGGFGLVAWGIVAVAMVAMLRRWTGDAKA